jgi:hypothetical protein
MTQQTDSTEPRVVRSAPSAWILSGAIVLAALLYFLVHLHSAVPAGRSMALVYNTVTGSVEFCVGASCQ